MNDFTCRECGKSKAIQKSGGTGYATNRQGEKICYECCGKIDNETMIQKGIMLLYLTIDRVGPHDPYGVGHVGNWPNTLSFPCTVKKGRHNMAGVRFDAWFNGPDGFRWHGTQYGKMSQICYCRRTKERTQV
jgi:hypothetical protein